MSKPRILVVVSDQLQRLAVGKLLRDKGYEVVEATNGPNALAALRAAPRLFVGVFLALPPFEEDRFLRAHRSDERIAQIPIIAASQPS